MKDDVVEKIICRGRIRKRHQKLRRIGKKCLHLLATFVFGVAVATIYHQIATSGQVRAGAERICTVFGKNEAECKNNIDNVLDMSDDEVQNNININGGG